ncbi:MAG: glycosyltransferase family 2 protein [Micavibrio sp.]
MTRIFSIITITRHHLAGLKQTATSLAQENPDLFEWIVIDGASTDGTPEYLKTTNAHWISEPDHGIYDAMNKGLERATGDYVLFLNAGDTLALPRTLEKLALILKARPQTPDLIYGDAFETIAGQQIIKAARPAVTIDQGLFTHHQSIFYRRETINDLRYDQRYNIAADYKFTAQFLRRCHDIFYWPVPLCHFETGGISQRQASKGRMQQFLIRRELEMSGPLAEIVILTRQTLAYRLRRHVPKLYGYLRAGRS